MFYVFDRKAGTVYSIKKVTHDVMEEVLKGNIEVVKLATEFQKLVISHNHLNNIIQNWEKV